MYYKTDSNLHLTRQPECFLNVALKEGCDSEVLNQAKEWLCLTELVRVYIIWENLTVQKATEAT